MLPLIPEKSFIFTVKICSRPKAGDILIFNHLKYGKLIKKLIFIDRYSQLWFKGQNSNSLSIIDIGPINRGQVLGKVFFIISPKKLTFLK